MKSLVILFTLCAIVGKSSCGNVLFINGIPSPSHHLFNRVLVVGLAEKGHNVTFLSVDKAKKETPNVHYVHLEKTYEIFFNGEESMDMLAFADQTEIDSVVELPEVCELVCDGILASKGLDDLLNYPKDFKFDAVIYDFTFGPCLLPLLHRFNYPPLISISAFSNPPYTTDWVGGQKYPAYVPHYAVTYPQQMTFTQRVFNAYLYFIDWW
jgi:glucuronosyltransferase